MTRASDVSQGGPRDGCLARAGLLTGLEAPAAPQEPSMAFPTPAGLALASPSPPAPEPEPAASAPPSSLIGKAPT